MIPTRRWLAEAAAGTARAVVSQFSGNYLDRAWTRRFILGSVLQRYDPPAASETAVPASDVDVAISSTLRLLSELWSLPVKPLDATSSERILRLLARYACGDGLLSIEALDELNAAMSHIPGAPTALDHPAHMEALLQAIRYVAPGDNIRRVSYSGQLHYSPHAESVMQPFLTDKLQCDGGDAFDAVRVRYHEPAYAIDSATTSEVDDAIGIHVDPDGGEEFFCVHVSDATVYCPFDSQLEQITARALTTTTYLPEGVYFMLPKPIVAAATLREDRPCRTFTIRFQLNETTGAVQNYSVHVGWLQHLRRITYDQAQALLVPPAPPAAATATHSSESTASTAPPSWMTPADEKKLIRIYEAAKLRVATRLSRSFGDARGTAGGRGGGPVDVSLPDPLVTVRGTHVVSVQDQVLLTQDARLAVAELMIAANEVCARVAEQHGIPIPHRGTRALSSDHETAQYYTEPQGVQVAASLDPSHIFMAEEMQRSVRRLQGVTRAVYHHVPLYHAGLDTVHYTHSTSPLRRYADMLVHHQLKLWIWKQCGGTTLNNAGGGPLMLAQAIPEYAMATLCTMISTRQEQASILQDNSTRFWILRYIADSVARAESEGGSLSYICLVGETRTVRAAPEYRRDAFSSEIAFAALMSPSTETVDVEAAMAAGAAYEYVSDIYIPELQLAHTLCHSCAGAVIGALVRCTVACVMPTQGVLELHMAEVTAGADEREYERILRAGAVASLDA